MINRIVKSFIFRYKRYNYNNQINQLKKNFLSKENLYWIQIQGEIFYTNHPFSFPNLYEKIFRDEIYKVPESNEKIYIIDCGANIGLGMKYWNKKLNNVEFLGFEPDPFVFKALKKNFEKESNFRLLNMALSDKEDFLNFTSNGGISGSLNLTKKLDSLVKVPVVKLSDFIDRNVFLLKIDIEGEEIKVIKEIQHKLKYVKFLFIEYHSFISQEQELSIILEILEANNFRYYLDSDVKKNFPFVNNKVVYNQDLQINIWASRI
jgi:FkbM family methyltransferase